MKEFGMAFEEMKSLKERAGLSNAKLSELSGVPLGTLNKILSGATRSPRYENLLAIERALLKHQGIVGQGYYEEIWQMHQEDAGGVIREAAKKYGSAQVTAEEFLSMAGEHQAELIDGVIYYLNTPSTNHQTMVMEISYLLKDYIRKHDGGCSVIMAPYCVQLEEDDEYNCLQPDVLVVCDTEKLKTSHMVGAPDLIVEVLSPGTRSRDVKIKMAKYCSAGVREYWMIDIENRRVMVYDWMSEEGIQGLYSFDDRVEVHLFEGLSINMKEVSQALL